MVYNDVLGIRLICVLMQRDRVIAYTSQQMKVHKNYLMHDLELATVVSTLQIWRDYLYGLSIKLYSDHKSLKYIFTQKEFNCRQRRRFKFLTDYGIEIAYQSTKANVVADALSRRPVLNVARLAMTRIQYDD